MQQPSLEQNKAFDIKESYIWNHYNMYPVAKVVNANNNEIAYSSFETDEANSKLDIVTTNIVENPSVAFTGKKYYAISSFLTTNITASSSKIYKLSFWSKGGRVSVAHFNNGSYVFLPDPVVLKTKSTWNYYEVLMPQNFSGIAGINKIFASDAVLIDEVRLIPAQSQMNTYTFNPLIGMTSESDVNGKTTYYEYDALNRLSVVRNEDKDIIKTICYNYANQAVPCASSCLPPVINSATRTGGLNVTLDFTAPASSTNCTIQVTDVNTGSVWNEPPGCNSPRAITIPNKFHQYSVIIVSYSPQCPNGTASLPFSF